MTTHPFHSGSFRLPEGATLLGSTDRYRELLRKENAEELRAPDDGVRRIDRWMERRALRPDQPR